MNKKETLKKYLKLLKEVDVHEPLKKIFTSKGYRAYVTHNPNEKGKDIVATDEVENLLITVKKGDIDTAKWNRDVHPTLTKLTRTNINHSQIKEELPRRYILVFTGELKPMMANTIAEINNKQKELGEPIVEYWDINNLVDEFDKNLMNSQLFMNDDLIELLISIKKEEVNSNFVKQYVDNHCLHQKPVILNLILLLILRKSQQVHNIYAFFYFIEYLMIRIWSNDNFQNYNKRGKLSLFDEVNALYVNELELWLQKNKKLLSSKFGLFDDNAKVWSEVIGYSLRTHNFLRRICYLLLNSSKDTTQYVKILTKLLDNNLHVLSMPIFEFHFNTIGLGIISLIENKRIVEAQDWYKNIVRNLIFHFYEGYAVLPVGQDICKVGHYALKKKSIELTSVISILLEFSYILEDKDSYEMILNWINYRFSNRTIRERLLPIEKYESEIYADEILNYQELRIELSGNWTKDKKNYFNMLQKITRMYSFYTKKRIFVPLLIDSIYKDRLLQEIWRIPVIGSRVNN
jgi:hypothetical protein